MPPDPVLQPIAESEKDLLRNLMQAYRHDMSEFNNAVPDEKGSFGVGNYFDVYWTEPFRYPFKILVNKALAGFALVRELAPHTHSVAEFFILRRHRKTGVGRATAFALFDKFPGTWHISQDEHNVPAQCFWRKVIGEYTDGNFEETWSVSHPLGPKQIFVSTLP